jgi:excreted virulence factor EspC (type VII ESX diderm)
VPDGFRVDPDELDTHSKHVEASLDQVSEALSAARQVAMPTEAYGRICQFFPPRLDPAENKGIEALQAAVEAFTNVHTSLTASARTYGGQDDAAADSLRGQ